MIRWANFLQRFQARQCLEFYCKMNNLSCFPSVNEPPDLTDLRHLAYTISFPIILGIGFLFNTFSLYAAAKSALNSVALSYLLAMILSNLSLMFLAIPWLIYRSTEMSNECYVHSNAFYHAYLELPLLNWMATFSTYVLLCMSVERYVSVSHLVLFRKIHRLPIARTVLIVSLILTLLIHAPMCLKLSVACPDCWTVIPNIEETSTTWWRIYIWISQMIARFIPCAALIILNIGTIIKYRKIIYKRTRMTTDAVTNSTPNSSLNNLSLNVKPKKPTLNSSSQDEKRQLKLLSGLVCLVAICIVPTGVAAVLPPGNGPNYYTFWVVVEGLELFHHALVSFVICLCNNDIHRRLGKMITCNSDSVWFDFTNDGERGFLSNDKIFKALTGHQFKCHKETEYYNMRHASI